MELKIELGLDRLARLMNFLESERNSLPHVDIAEFRKAFAVLREVRPSGSQARYFAVTLDLCEEYRMKEHPLREPVLVSIGATQLLDFFQAINRFPQS